MRSSFPPCPDFQSGTLRRAQKSGVGLIELLVMIGIMTIVLLVIFQFMGEIDRAWKLAGYDPFAGAEEAFDDVARNLAAATLEPYSDYADTSGAFRTSGAADFVPDHLARRSDLGFACGPAADFLTAQGRVVTGSAVFFFARGGYTTLYANSGMGQLLNAGGYFVDFGPDDARPSFLTAKASWRWRLRQVIQPAENLQILAQPNEAAWWQGMLQNNATTPALVENIIAFVVLPQRDGNGEILSPDYRYDSRDASNALTRNQLPACLRLAVVALDEVSAQRLAAQNGTSPPELISTGLFQQAARFDADLAALDAALTAQKLGHLVLQRTLTLPSSAWSEVASR